MDCSFWTFWNIESGAVPDTEDGGCLLDRVPDGALHRHHLVGSLHTCLDFDAPSVLLDNPW